MTKVFHYGRPGQAKVGRGQASTVSAHSASDSRKSELLERSVVSVGEILRYLRDDHYMTKAEARRYTGLSARTLERAKASLPRYRFSENGKVLFKKSEIDQWMLKHREDSDIDLDETVKKALQGLKRKQRSNNKSVGSSTENEQKP